MAPNNRILRDSSSRDVWSGREGKAEASGLALPEALFVFIGSDRLVLTIALYGLHA